LKWGGRDKCPFTHETKSNLVRQIALCLSENTIVTPCEIPNSITRPYNQVVSFTASVAATYLTSVVERATIN